MMFNKHSPVEGGGNIKPTKKKPEHTNEERGSCFCTVYI